MYTQGEIFGINGPVVQVVGSKEFKMSEMVMVGHERLIGEVINIFADKTIVQVFEDTTGLRPKEPVVGEGTPISATLGPGIIGNIFDGIQRPLAAIEAMTGRYIGRGLNVSALDTEKKWDVTMTAQIGEKVSTGSIIATVQETPSILHKVMIPPSVAGEIVSIKASGSYTIEDVIAVVKDQAGKEHEIKMMQKWPIKTPRPMARRRSAEVPLVTGQRIIDTLFPIAKGGTAALPGGFGTGKTMTQHQLAKWSDADIIVYIGCGERGNEMTQVLEDFSGLKDPRMGQGLMDRTVLIANTSNMPVAAREASIYTGLTLAEYYRDMGYHVAIMADSTSRWAEALRELSGRLEEMPAEEGFPAYLASRLSKFYERGGYVDNLNGTEGSVTIIGAVSPQGGDFSEPVTQNTKRFVRCFWTLDRALAYARHYPAIQWMTSYSEYIDDISPWYYEHAGENFLDYRSEILRLLNEESALNEIVKLIGADVLPDSQKLTLEIARVIRLGFVQQNAYHPSDTYVPLEKQQKMMEVILSLYDKCKRLVALNIGMSRIRQHEIFDKVIAMKYDIPNDKPELFDDYMSAVDAFYDDVHNKNI